MSLPLVAVLTVTLLATPTRSLAEGLHAARRSPGLAALPGLGLVAVANLLQCIHVPLLATPTRKHLAEGTRGAAPKRRLLAADGVCASSLRAGE